MPSIKLNDTDPCSKCGAIDWFQSGGNPYRRCAECNRRCAVKCHWANREKRLKYSKTYRDANKEKRSAYAKLYYIKHKETLMAKKKAKLAELIETRIAWNLRHDRTPA